MHSRNVKIGKLPIKVFLLQFVSKKCWKKLSWLTKVYAEGSGNFKEFQGHSWISSSFQPRHFFHLIRKYLV